jgi:hypothetical protein
MQKILIALALLTLGSTAQAQTNVGVSVSLGQPGFYGTIDLNNYPAPQVIYAQPRVIQASPVIVEPVYLRVPPGHRRHWDRYCGRYDACNRPVYFVSDNWYNKVYVPQYRNQGHGDYRRDDGPRNDGPRDNGPKNDGPRDNYHGGDRHDDHHDRDNGRGPR